MIKYLVMDVDGTLTNGKIYMGINGELAKAFDIKDGAGIVLILPEEKITPIIITARESKILANRCKELNITSIYQNIDDKLAKLNEVVSDLSSVAYVGDDLPDIPCMLAVKSAGGLVFAPADAIPEIRSLADYTSSFKGGEGAIRDCINHLIKHNKNEEKLIIANKVQKTIKQILATDYSNYNAGEHKLLDGTIINFQVYNTKDEKDCVIESHRSHIDIQLMVEGVERFKIYNTSSVSLTGDYNKEIDSEFYNYGMETTESILVPGSLIVVYNGQPHKGAINFESESKTVKKVVCKIEI